MKKCPSCGATLPQVAVSCQFCGARLGGPPPVRRPIDTRPRADVFAPGVPRWAIVAYHLIAAYWVLKGIWSVVEFFLLKPEGAEFVALPFAFIPIIIGGGLLLRIEAIRGLVNVMAGIQLITGGLGAVVAFFAGQPLALVLSLLQIATAALMIYVIGETDTRPPDL